MHMLVVWFYTKAYIQQNQSSTQNERTAWYVQNRKHILNTQMGFVISMPILAVVLLPNVYKSLQLITVNQWLLLSIPIVLAIGYYGINEKLNLRRFLLLKPISIAVIWSFIASFLPIVYNQLQTQKDLFIEHRVWNWFLVNFFFVLTIAIMFDIKDYAADANVPIKTFVTKYGLKNTIKNGLIPLCVVNIIVFYLFWNRYFTNDVLLYINLIPYLLLLAVCISLYHPKKIFYYLIVIDGLMFVKALINIISFKYLH